MPSIFEDIDPWSLLVAPIIPRTANELNADATRRATWRRMMFVDEAVVPRSAVFELEMRAREVVRERIEIHDNMFLDMRPRRAAEQAKQVAPDRSRLEAELLGGVI